MLEQQFFTQFLLQFTSWDELNFRWTFYTNIVKIVLNSVI